VWARWSEDEVEEMGLGHQSVNRKKGGVSLQMVAEASRLTDVLEILPKASVPCQLICGAGHQPKDDEEQEKG
jgi:hypothetical protein